MKAGKEGGKYETIVEAVNKVLGQYRGRLSLRQIYYRLVSAHVIPNNLNQYKALSKYLVKARENREVDWTRIEDRNRSTTGWDHGYEEAPDPERYVARRIEEAVRDPWISFKMWLNQPERVEVWIEKDALSVLASGVAGRYNVTTCPSKGYSSFTYVMEAVRRINQYDAPVTVLYFGDYDPSGMDITRDLRERLRAYGAHNLEKVERICLSREQIDEHQLPPFPAKSSDVRYAKFVADTGSDDAVELDALEPPVLEAYIEEAIKEHFDENIYAEVKKAETKANEAITEALKPLRELLAKYAPEDD